MAGFWILSVIFSTMSTFQPGRRRVTAQSLTEPEVYWPVERLSVDICDSAHLQCCILNNREGEIFWFKHQNGKAPVFIAGPFTPDGETFSSEFQNPRFQIKKNGKSCFSMTISNTTLSDDATYYCALMFSAKTSLKIKESGTSEPAPCDNSAASEPHGNRTNMNTREKTVSEMTRALHRTVLGLGTALGLCALLIFCLTYFILRRRKCENSKLKASIENSAGSSQESESETMDYAALKFSKQKAKAEKRKPASSDECVYADVKKL